MQFIKKIKSSKLLKNTFIYTLFRLFNKAIPFLLLPILTHYLTPDDYGMIATYNSFLGLVSVFVGLSLEGAINVSYFQLKQKELQIYISSVFIILISSTLFVFLAIVFFQPYLTEKFQLSVFWLNIVVFAALMQNITGINLTLWIAQQKAKPFALYEMFQVLLNVSLSLIFVILLHYGWEGRVSGMVVATVSFGVLSMFFIFKRGYATYTFSKKYILDALKFGIPLIPHRFALWLQAGIDILFITAIVGVSEAGLYSVGLTFGMIVVIFGRAFNNAFSPYLYEKLSNPSFDTKRDLVKLTYLYFIGIIIFAMFLSTLFIWLLPYIIGEKFQEAAKYIYWISLAGAFQGMYFMVVNYIFYVKKTHLLSMVTVTTSLFGAGLSYILISYFGAIGAAYASVVTFFLTFIFVWKLSSKVYSMPWFQIQRKEQ